MIVAVRWFVGVLSEVLDLLKVAIPTIAPMRTRDAAAAMATMYRFFGFCGGVAVLASSGGLVLTSGFIVAPVVCKPFV